MHPALGFETIGNATVLVYENSLPLLVTDPWIQGSAYFGSWCLSHEVPTEQYEAALRSEYVWFSHGHPDHLNPDCVGLFKDKKILLPDHVGGRIRDDLTSQGYQVTVLADRTWTQLGPKVSVYCVADYNQDAVLLININGRLVLNLNDASDHGWHRSVKNEAKQFKTKILLALFGYGDADMINFFNDDGSRVIPWAARREPVGASIAASMKEWDADYCIPFSSLHHYQRADSVWANEYVTGLDDYARGFDLKRQKLLAPFIRFDCETDQYAKISPKENRIEIKSPEEFGDSWSEQLTPADETKIESYFKKIEHFENAVDFVRFRVGGKDFTVNLGQDSGLGVTFEVPRGSLMVSIEYRIFDDLLIGNFMKTTLHGKWPPMGLYPDFAPFLVKYSDNGNAHSKQELNQYLDHYRKRSPLEYFMHRIRRTSSFGIRSALANFRGNSLYSVGRKIYRKLK